MAKNLFESCLSNRKQFVLLNESDSSLKPVLGDVPRGSVLGPLFFLAYINDLQKCVYHFADDTNILRSESSLKM